MSDSRTRLAARYRSITRADAAASRGLARFAKGLRSPIRWFAALFALISCAGMTASASASTTIDIRGTYVGTAEANGSNYSNMSVIDQEDCAAGTFSGHGVGYSNFSGTINGNQLVNHEVYTKVTYTADGTGTLSTDSQGRLVNTGNFHDSYGQSGTYSSTRISKPSDNICASTTTTSTTTATTTTTATSGGQRPSGLSVVCNFEVLTAMDTCTAQVGDGGAPPRPTPTGAVTFASENGGVFSVGATCTLRPTSLSPGVASCSVQYIPSASGAFPRIRARYTGDSQHLPSSGQTQFIIAAVPEGPPKSCGGAAARDSALWFGPLATAATSAAEKRAAACLQAAAAISGGLVAAGGFFAALLCEDASVAIATPLCILINRVAQGGAAALAIDAGAFQVIINDPPRSDFKRIPVPRVSRISVPQPRGRFAGPERQGDALIMLEARLRATMSAFEVSRDRAGGARRAHQPVWERRQMLANARFAKSAASLFSALAARSAQWAQALRRAGLARQSVSASAVRRFVQGVATHGLPTTIARSLRANGVGTPGQRTLDQVILKALPSQISRDLVDVVSSSKLLSGYRSDAAWLRAYSRRVAHHPSATQV